MAKSKAKKEQINQNIKALLNAEREFDTLNVAKQKINGFVN